MHSKIKKKIIQWMILFDGHFLLGLSQKIEEEELLIINKSREYKMIKRIHPY
jgi:hypothetical protein